MAQHCAIFSDQRVKQAFPSTPSPRAAVGGAGWGAPMARTESDRSDPRTSNDRRLRRKSTPAERPVWAALLSRERPAGHFRRQAPIGPYVVDYTDRAGALVIEVDGDTHATA